MATSELRVFGVRHHGPGCARALERELASYAPDLVLVEGPTDGTDVLPMLAMEGFKPPVALLVYPQDQPIASAFYPFASFSPEWRALRWASREGVTAAFIDLPRGAHWPGDKPVVVDDDGEDGLDPEHAADEEAHANHVDPIGELARAAGFSDAEVWWEQVVEARHDPSDVFEAILEGMTAVRDAHCPGLEAKTQREARREAWMRKRIRIGIKSGAARIAVVCGAWHAPVLTEAFIKRRGQVGADNATLKGMRQRKSVATWVPWTAARLAFQSGYGAGVTAPAWYHLLFRAPTQATALWVTKAARLLRKQGLDTSSAHVIEAVRLSETLAALRGLTRPGLAELQESMVSVYLQGFPDALSLIADTLLIGNTLGKVPAGAPTAPLHQDVLSKQKRLRLKPKAEPHELRIDLRKPNGLARSQLLWQLRVLNVPWGNPHAGIAGGLGTFWEGWMLDWDPEFVVALVTANAFGSTTEVAATHMIADAARNGTDLAAIANLLDTTIRCGLPDSVTVLVDKLDELAATSGDVISMMGALPGIAESARYGDLRKMPTDRLLVLLDGLLERILAGLAPATTGIDEDTARRVADGMGAVVNTLALRDDDELHDAWAHALGELVERSATEALVRGFAARLLLDTHIIDGERLALLAQRELSLANPPLEAAAWLEGMLRGSGTALMTRDELWTALDAWLAALASEHFDGQLPSLRRAFSTFTAAERRRLGAKLKHLDAVGATAQDGTAAMVELVDERAARVLPTLAALMGLGGESA